MHMPSEGTLPSDSEVKKPFKLEVNYQKRQIPMFTFLLQKLWAIIPSEGICILTQREKLTYGNYDVFALCIRGQSIKQCTSLLLSFIRLAKGPFNNYVDRF
jgi:hypothetical protein